jgi:hypothetical protein
LIYGFVICAILSYVVYSFVLVNKSIEMFKNRKHNFNKIFQIGFNKCGTTSLFKYFEFANIKCIHHDSGKLADTMIHNFENNKPLLKNYEDYIFFSDMENMPFYPHIEHYKLLDKQYPNSKFILNIRKKQDWLKSRQNHGSGKYIKKSMKTYNLNKEKVIEKWSKEWDNHLKDIKEYFKKRPNDLLIYDIDNDTSRKIDDFLPTLTFKNKTLGTYNKTN